jgi:PBP1b-binding outer membrane lipoprotein LpoB
MKKKNMQLMALMGTLFVAACSEPPPPKTVIDTGRPETKSLEAADAIGYNGKAIRQKVDKGLDANDANNERMQKQMQDM